VTVTVGILGVILLITGLAIVFSIIGIGAMLIGPLFLLLIGVILLKNSLRFLGLVFVFLGILALFNIVFHIHIGGILVAIIFLYIGIKLLRKKDKSPSNHDVRQGQYGRTIDSDDKNWVDDGIHHAKKSSNKLYKETVLQATQRRSFIGDLYLMHHQFELENMNVWHGIGDVKIDLSKAMIPEGETVLVINGWIGDIDIYIPYDVDVSVHASVTFGELEVLNRRQGGLGRQLSVATKDYPDSTRRVKIILSLLIGDIDVRFL
jgi:lia operon protein LiaF